MQKDEMAFEPLVKETSLDGKDSAQLLNVT